MKADTETGRDDYELEEQCPYGYVDGKGRDSYLNGQDKVNEKGALVTYMNVLEK